MHNLRPAQTEDDDFLREVYRSTRAAEAAAFGWPGDVVADFIDMQYSARRGAYEMQFPQAEYLVIEVDGQRAGSIILHETPEELRLVDIALLPLFRRQGIGGSLIAKLKRRAAEHEVPIVLHVDSSNLPAIALYTGMQFEIVENGPVRHRMSWQEK
jgi:ribosomal protein S18 acetylase RimI-like enzyme